MPKGGNQHCNDSPQRFDRETPVNVDNEPPLHRHVPGSHTSSYVTRLGRILVNIVNGLKIVRRQGSILFAPDYDKSVNDIQSRGSITVLTNSAKR